MKIFEKVSVWIRHLPLLEHAEWLWNPVRPIYQRAVSHFGERGLERLINGSDRILVSPRARDVSEKYELDVWRALMAELRTGDTFVDVGAYIGLYTIAVGLRLRGSGRIIAFEPDNHNFSLLQQHVKLNGLETKIELHPCAVSDKDGRYGFSAECSAMSHLVSPGANYATTIQVIRLDSIFAGERIDILKIDVEGYEEMVLRGAYDILRSPARRPRIVFVEVHPYAWPSLGTTSASLFSLLSASGYHAETLSGQPVRHIERHGEIVARIMR